MYTKENNMQEITKNFRIRNKLTGKYQRAGSWVSWDHKGKTWTTKSSLSNHLRLISRHFGSKYYDPENWEIVTIEVIKTPINTTDFKDW